MLCSSPLFRVKINRVVSATSPRGGYNVDRRSPGAMKMGDNTHCIEELQEDMEDLRLAHAAIANTTRLNEILRPHGVEVLEYEGPARYELGRPLRCEICGEPIDVTHLAYELRLMSAAWGPRFGYLHQQCFDLATRDEEAPAAPLESFAGAKA